MRTTIQKAVCRLLPALLAAGLLCGCTAQSVQLGRRAMVRLIYLEKTAEGYEALTMVCDFSGGEEGAEAVTALSARADTVDAALYAAASAAGGEPFFAKNGLLLLGPRLAQRHLAQVLAAFSGACGLYRDPAVFLWYGGAQALQNMPDAMTFVRTAETLAAEGAQGCVWHVLESDDTGLPPALPVLGMGEEGQSPHAAVEGLIIFAPGMRRYDDPALVQGYGLLRGRLQRLQLSLQWQGQSYTLRLERLRRHVQRQGERLQIRISGVADALPAAPLTARTALQAAAQQALARQCAAAWATLTQDGCADLFKFKWWAAQLGVAGSAAPQFSADIRLE